jgi:hypothetical protein
MLFFFALFLVFCFAPASIYTDQPRFILFAVDWIYVQPRNLTYEPSYSVSFPLSHECIIEALSYFTPLLSISHSAYSISEQGGYRPSGGLSASPFIEIIAYGVRSSRAFDWAWVMIPDAVPTTLFFLSRNFE